MHVDKHCVKMILEYAQMLSTAHRVLDGNEKIVLSSRNRKVKRYELDDERECVLYAAAFVNHPSAVWARSSEENYSYLYRLWACLLQEYTFRYKKSHKTSRLESTLSTPPRAIARGKFCEPPLAMPEKYKQLDSAVQSYRSYYLGEKSHMFSWKSRETPLFVKSIK